MATRKPSPCPEFVRTREFIGRFTHLPTPEDLDVLALWAMGTWTFSPAAPANPATYPYLYLTGGKGSGKTHTGQEVLQYVCRNHKSIVNVTGGSLFRLIGTWDEESGEVQPHYPTLAIDEIDAVYASGGSNDEALRGVCNGGYKRGQTVPRASGKTTIEFPVYCPKLFIGIDNGRLPDTVADRCIRINMKQATPEQVAELEEGPYSYEVEEESAELKQTLSEWAKREAMVLRDYRPERIDGVSPRQWEIARSLVQLARAAGIEDRIRTALHTIMTRTPQQNSGKDALYRSIFHLFEELDTDRLTSVQVLARLTADGIRVPGSSGNSGKGLTSVLSVDGIQPKPISLPEGHPGRMIETRGKAARKGKGSDTVKTDQRVQRGYLRFMFDEVFMEYVLTDSEAAS